MSSDASRTSVRPESRSVATPDGIAVSADPAPDSPASDRAELLRRRVEVQVLRQAIERERDRRQRVVDRYEALLEERTAESPGEEAADPAGVRGFLAAIRRRLTPRRRRV